MSDLTDLDSGGAWLLDRSSGRARQSLVILRHVADLFGLPRVVIDPELGVGLGHQVGDALHRRDSLVLVDVHTRNAAIVEVFLKVGDIPAQDQPPGALVHMAG